MKKQALIYLLVAIVFFSIMFVGCGTQKYGCPAVKNMSGYK